MIQQNRPQFQQYPLSQHPIPNPNFTQLSPTLPAAGFYTSTPHNLQPMMNHVIDANITQKVIEICDDNKEVRSAFDEIRSENDATNNTIFRLQQDLEDLHDRPVASSTTTCLVSSTTTGAFSVITNLSNVFNSNQQSVFNNNLPSVFNNNQPSAINNNMPSVFNNNQPSVLNNKPTQWLIQKQARCLQQQPAQNFQQQPA
ncbi:unnamed protein product [Mytilus coruscus]|uniref:Uncharacterized protein n=1 Tax=Mytilus coruscus TaxID=42192 RepID=A0A6J8DR03_MYTCO|nr:unnamed protein product [Mytilus coruscus]